MAKMVGQRVAVVTGANKGIGFATVKMLCERYPDWIVYLTARDVQRGQQAVQELHQSLNLKNATFHQLDVTSVESICRFATFLHENHPQGLSALVNNAGVGATEEGGSRDSADWNYICKVVETNYFGYVNVCHELFPLLVDGARVVNVSSTMGLIMYTQMSPEMQATFKNCQTEEEVSKLVKSFTQLSVEDFRQNGWITGDLLAQVAKIWNLTEVHVTGYCVAKLGMNILTAIQQKKFDELNGRKNVIVNSCCPGMVKSDMNQAATRLPEEGADLFVYLATLPEDENELRGKFFNQDKQVTDSLIWKPK